ncbi:MAG: argininosuccinate lyase [Acidimicrobiia bacterium]
MTLWGGRFESSMSAATWGFTTDDSDRRLLIVDIQGSIAHVTMLGAVEILPEQDAVTMVDGLNQVLDEAVAGEFVFVESDEDVHTAVERRLGELVGEVAGKLHTGRSRNDQVALDLRLYLMSAGQNQIAALNGLTLALADIAETHAETVVSSYTHLQQAQPTTLGHHLLAYAWMSLRSAQRFKDATARLSLSPLGAGAAAGSSLPLDRAMVSEALGMQKPMANSLDAVGSRDFVAEYVFCCAQAMTELSRLAEELILWSSSEFGWVRLGDEVSTGSSALPQKRNPDIAELVRGRAASVIGDVSAILALQKGLPLAYNRDLQEDKRIVFHADDTLSAAVPAMIDMLQGVTFEPPLPGPGASALDMAEALVRRGVPFREAHELVGRLVASMEESGRPLTDTKYDDMARIDVRFSESDLELLDPRRSLENRATLGSGNPESVRAQISELRGLISSD